MKLLELIEQVIERLQHKRRLAGAVAGAAA